VPGQRVGYALAWSALRRLPQRCATLMPAVLITRAGMGGLSARRSRVAQSAERPAVNRQVIGSSPIAGATFLQVRSGQRRAFVVRAISVR
jgi:hypothetical protein